jgi:hypothetical protein
MMVKAEDDSVIGHLRSRDMSSNLHMSCRGLWMQCVCVVSAV